MFVLDRFRQRWSGDGFACSWRLESRNTSCKLFIHSCLTGVYSTNLTRISIHKLQEGVACILILWMKIVSRFIRDIRLNQSVTHIPISFHTQGINLLCELKVVWRLETRITDSTIQLRLPSVESVQACALPDMLKPLDHSTAVPHYEHGDERQTPAKHINPCKITWWSTEKPPLYQSIRHKTKANPVLSHAYF